MGKVLDLLGRDFIEIRIKGVEFAIAHCRKQRKLPPVKLRRIFKKQVRIGESNYQPESEALQGLATDSLLELASLPTGQRSSTEPRSGYLSPGGARVGAYRRRDGFPAPGI